MVEMISEYVDDTSLISFQFSTKWKSIVKDENGNKIGDEMITSYKLLYEINMVEHTTCKGWKEEMLMEFLNDAI